ncbi:hypothetical protein LK518_06055 [Parabacteroides distasonis]|uniref:putative phage abortive infection protein n=1 Tax=Parabacteroides distasonis TaxID=823 RepID=UPI001D12E9BC|nr:putative phage abortive infection protein [Parabacteroides distasonis]MCC2778975.1 hypothetical protein [Parabacteroides distasonis]MCQ5181312.1 hypothetical protein [Parabacteroides distasonis]
MKQSIIRKILPLLKFLRDYKGFVILIAICTILFVLFLTGTLILSEKPNEFGDSAGATNGLFSALAFAGVIYAIFLQKNELELQRQELKDTRKEIAGQRKESELQNETLRRQRFENTFFQMMSLQQEIVNTLSYTYSIFTSKGKEHSVFKGRDVFRALYEKGNAYYIDIRQKKVDCQSLKEALYRKHYSFKKLTPDSSSQENPDVISFVEPYFDYSPYNDADQPQYLDHYFRHLYRMVKFIDETKLLPDDFDERYQYTSMIRATFSRYEFVWLFYNGLSENGVEKFKPLIEKYALLRGIRLDLLAINEETQTYQETIDSESDDLIYSKHSYNKSAFVKTQPRT